MSLTAPSRLVVHPGRALSGVVRPPGDKSITHRAYILGGMAEGETVVEGANPGADCESTLTCLEALGVEVRRESSRVTLRGRAMRFEKPDRVLDCGNSGTTLRLLSGPLAAQPFRSTLSGDASLQKRPVDRVIEPLRLMGAKLSARENDRVPPLEIEGGPLRSIDYHVRSRSAQVASCILLAGLFAPGTTRVRVENARDHTQRMLPAFGAAVEAEAAEGDRIPAASVRGPIALQGTSLRIAGDFSSAAFFLAAAAATPGASITAQGVTLNPTRSGMISILSSMGARIQVQETGVEAGEPVGHVTVTGPERLTASEIREAMLPTLVDEVPAWAMAAACAEGVSRLHGGGELRVKESDRIAALATNLRRLGIETEESPDGLAIHGGRLRAGTVDAAGDHRIAMAFAIAGLLADGPVTVSGAREISTSYPGFVAALRDLGGEVEIPEEDALAR